jgi:CelD/BcsL family acetyltransferase involved in cellulose biosynthesis
MDPRLDLFLEAFPPGRFRVAEGESMPCAYAELPDTWEQYTKDHLSRNARQKMKQALRRVEELDGFRVTHVSRETADEHIEVLLRLWQTRWGARSERKLRQLRTLFQRCLENECLYLVVMWAGDTPITALGGFEDRWKKVLSSFITGFDPHFASVSPGMAVMAYSTQYAIENGFRVYDHLRGAENYKGSYAVQERFTRNVVVTRKTLRMNLVHLARRVRGLEGTAACASGSEE